MKMRRLSRRRLLKSVAAGAASAVAVPSFLPSGILASEEKPGANDRITIGAIGVGNRASLLLDQLPSHGQIVALSDCNLPRADVFKAARKGKWHLQNWLDCIRTRQQPVPDVEIGHRSISVCHLANITRWVGRRLKWDPAKERFLDADEANRYADRSRREGYTLPAAL